MYSMKSHYQATILCCLMDNVLLTPHMGYVTQETYVNFYGQTLENVRSYIEGNPQRVMNPDVLANRR